MDTQKTILDPSGWHTIKGFTTKKNIAQQLRDAGVKGIKLPFKAESKLKIDNNPVPEMELLDFEGNKQEIE